LEKGEDSRIFDQKGPRRESEKMRAEANIGRNRASVDKGVLSADHATADFLKGMSHELHTPLNVIIGLCQILGRDRATSLSPTQRDSVERMERNAQSLLHTIDHLLACLRSCYFM